MNFPFAFILASLSGLYTSLWGAFKDSPYEGFKPGTFPRSVYFSAVFFLVLFALPFYRERLVGLHYFHIFFLMMGMERIIAEIYKGFFRTEDQDKYFVPSRITLLGKFVASDLLRYSVGAVIIIGTFSVLLIDFKISTQIEFLIVSYGAGLLVSMGGAYKDAPFEGFSYLKFQKSPLVLSSTFLLFYYLGEVSLGLLICMNIGLERFMVEYYKTFIERDMSGKFRPDLKRIQHYLDIREKFHYGALVIIAGLIALYIYESRSI